MKPTALLAALLLTLPLAACRDESATPATLASLSERYVVRGVLMALPKPGDELRKIQVHHEEIPTFRDMDGKTVGMMEMVMPFPLAESVSLEGFAVGDKLNITFEVQWEGRPPYRITKLVKLPAETELAIEGDDDTGESKEHVHSHDHEGHEH